MFRRALALLFAALCLAGAAGQARAADAEPLRVWFDSNVRENDEMRAIAADFERETGTAVEVVDRRSVFDAPRDLMNNAQTPQRPDLVLMQAPDIGDLAVSGFLLPLELPNGVLDRFSDVSRDAFRLNGRLYGLGYSVETSGLIYNKALIREEELPRDWEAFFRKAGELTLRGPDGQVLQHGTLLNPRDMWFNYPLIRAHGGYYYGRKDGHWDPYDIGLNQPGMLDYVDRMKKLMADGQALTSPVGMESHIVAQFSKGQVAMMLYGLWSAQAMRAGGVDYGLASLPANRDGSPSQPLCTVVGFVVNAHSHQPEEAMRFLAFLSQDGRQQRLIEAGNGGEQKTGQRNPACLAVARSAYIQGDETLRALARLGADAEPFPNIPEGTIWYNYTGTAFRSIFFGDSSGQPREPQAALDELVGSIAGDVMKMNEQPAPVSIPPLFYPAAAAALAPFGVLLWLRARRRAGRKAKERFNRRTTLAAWLLLSPAIVLLGLFYLYPILHNFWISLTNYSGLQLQDPYFVGLHNYGQIFGENLAGLGGMFLWTLVFALSVVSLSFLLGVRLATVLDNVGPRASKVYRVIYVLPWVIPAVITLLTWQGLLSDVGGPVNTALGALGVPPLPFLSNPWWARGSTIFVMTWFSFPYYTVIALGFLQSIPRELYEAALIDGVGRRQVFRHITLPMVYRAMKPTLIMGFLMQFNQFGVYMLTQGGPPADRLGSPGATDLMITFVFNLAFNTRRYSLAAAYSVIIFVFIAAFTLASMRLSRRGRSGA